jgi:phenylalanyl-tRNA synthetase alpha chain
MADVASLAQELEQLSHEAAAAVGQARSADDLEQLRVKFLGRKSRLADVMKSLGQLSGEQRAEVGKRANQFKTALEAQLASQRTVLASTPPAVAVVGRNRIVRFSSST